MRGRHAYAMLSMMGVSETIAASEAEFIDIAVRMGLDKEYYRKIKSRIKENHNRLYKDKSCVRALEDFYRFFIQQHKQPLA